MEEYKRFLKFQLRLSLKANMMYNYVSKCSNHVHQLVVSISNHLYLLKNGEMGYQKKSFGLNLKNYHKSSKRHIIHYIIKDHFSGAIYGELYPTDKVQSLDKFLFNAWRIKKDYKFHGLPECLLVPKTVIGYYPNIVKLFKNTNIRYEEAMSGFHAGAPTVIKEWEKQIGYANTIIYGNLSFGKLQENIEHFNNSLNSHKSNGSGMSKIDKWNTNLDKINTITNETEFFNIFN